MSTPGANVDLQWLTLRGPADSSARSAGGSGLAAELNRYLVRRMDTRSLHASDGSEAPSARLVDVGAGTGAGAAWLRPRLAVSQDWRLVDRDGCLLDAAAPVRDGWARAVVADIADLPSVLAREAPDAVTCQALLDLLTAEQVGMFLGAATDCRAAVLLALTVAGHVAMDPGHPDDELVNDAFNAHQHRGGRLGPDAISVATQLLRAHGYVVSTASTPWVLDHLQRELCEEWLIGRAQAAAEQTPESAERVNSWLATRLAATRRGETVATIGHVDVLGIPPQT